MASVGSAPAHDFQHRQVEPAYPPHQELAALRQSVRKTSHAEGQTCYIPAMWWLQTIGFMSLLALILAAMFGAVVWMVRAADLAAPLIAKREARVRAFELTLDAFRQTFAARRRV